MKKVVYSFPMKVLGVFLITLAGLLSVVFGAVIVIAYDAMFYYVPETYGSFDGAAGFLFENGHIGEYSFNNMTDRWKGAYEFVFYNRYSAIILMAVGVVAFTVLFIYLMRAAGRRGDTDEIVLGPLDKIPFDITLGLAVLVCFLLFLAATENHRVDAFMLGVVSGLGVVIFLIVLYVLYTFSARLKAGGFWRNTVTFKLLRLFWRGFKAVGGFLLRLLRAIPMVWRVSLVAAGYFILVMVSISSRFWYYDDGFMLFFIMMVLAAAVVVILGAAQMRALHKAARELAAGNLDYKVNTKHLYFDFRRHAENLNSLGEGMSAAVDQRMRSERLKTELITNVSHDIKTPLTSIVNYVDLLQKEHTPEEEVQYLDVLKRQSDKLRRLTVDLVEASKASTGNLPTELAPTNSSELINQAVAEYAERFEAGKLSPIVTLPEEPITVLADGRHLWRVLDNLFNNAVKYAQPGTRVYIDVRRSGGGAVITVKNISRDRLNVSAQELMERFVRGDQSRHTEGSGLGLSIALSLTELMGGSFDISVDGDLFKAEIALKTV